MRSMGGGARLREISPDPPRRPSEGPKGGARFAPPPPPAPGPPPPPPGGGGPSTALRAVPLPRNAGEDIPWSPRSVFREHEIPSLDDRVAGEAALGVVALRRLVRERAGCEGVGGGVVGEHGPSPSAAVGEALA